MHVCMMHVSMIIDPHACVFDACMMPMPMMWLKFCDGRTDEQGDSRSWIAMKHVIAVKSFFDHRSIEKGPD